LSDLLECALLDKNGTDPLVLSIKLGCAIAQSSEKGWDCPQVKEIVKKAGNFLHLSGEETAKTLHESARAAAEIAESYGANKSSRLVPLPMAAAPPLPERVVVIESAAEPPEANKSSRLVPLPTETTPPLPKRVVAIEHEYPKPDLKIQMNSLRDLSSLVASGKGDFNMALSIVLEGIYRGIGVDRVIFMLLTPDRQHLKGKHGLGWIDESYVENFRINANNSEMFNIFGYLLINSRPVWAKEKPDSGIKHLLTEELINLTGGGPFFAMPIAIKGTAIGVIYADRSRSGRCLDDESFESFAFFGQQANMCLSAVAGA